MPRQTTYDDDFANESEIGSPKIARPGQEAIRQTTYSTCIAKTLQEKSMAADTAVVVAIHNLLNVNLEVSWIDYDGQEVYYCTILPSYRMVVETYETHVWKISNPGYDFHTLYAATDIPKQVCVIRTAKGSLIMEGIADDESSRDIVHRAEQVSELVEDLVQKEEQEEALLDLKSEEKEEVKLLPQHDPKRCYECNKKLKLVSTHKCRCSFNFCTSHRMPEEHNCMFDFKEDGKRMLTKENPLVQSDKFRGDRL